MMSKNKNVLNKQSSK